MKTGKCESKGFALSEGILALQRDLGEAFIVLSLIVGEVELDLGVDAQLVSHGNWVRGQHLIWIVVRDIWIRGVGFRFRVFLSQDQPGYQTGDSEKGQSTQSKKETLLLAFGLEVSLVPLFAFVVGRVSIVQALVLVALLFIISRV